MTMEAIRFGETGGPEVMRLESVAQPKPGAHEILIRHGAIGVNFIDTYHRTGLYPVPLPSGLGLEGAGVVEAIGESVTRFKIGDRAGYCTGPIGAYAQCNVVPESRAVKIPAAINDDIAAAAMLKGMTARYLLRKTFRVEQGHTVVIHAAAGGVGQIAVQWARHLGASVIAIAGGPEKLNIVKNLGAHHLIDSKSEDIAKRVREITNGEGADVVYDSVGKDTFNASIDCLKPLGMFVSYGNASGPAPAVEPALLNQKGSLYFTRPSLFHYTRTPDLLQETANDLFDMIAREIVKVAPPSSYALAAARDAHHDLETRKTTGSLVLKP